MAVCRVKRNKMWGSGVSTYYTQATADCLITVRGHFDYSQPCILKTALRRATWVKIWGLGVRP